MHVQGRLQHSSIRLLQLLAHGPHLTPVKQNRFRSCSKQSGLCCGSLEVHTFLIMLREIQAEVFLTLKNGRFLSHLSMNRDTEWRNGGRPRFLGLPPNRR